MEQAFGYLIQLEDRQDIRTRW